MMSFIVCLLEIAGYGALTSGQSVLYCTVGAIKGRALAGCYISMKDDRRCVQLNKREIKPNIKYQRKKTYL